MSASLLTKIADHLANAGLLTDLTRKFYRWTDSDLAGAADFIVFRMAGTSGIRNATVQSPDVRISIFGKSANTVTTNNKADAIFANLAGMTKPSGVLKLEPIGSVMGASYLDNDRVMFEMVVRCFVQDM